MFARIRSSLTVTGPRCRISILVTLGPANWARAAGNRQKIARSKTNRKAAGARRASRERLRGRTDDFIRVSISRCSPLHLLVTIQFTHDSRLYLKLRGLATTKFDPLLRLNFVANFGRAFTERITLQLRQFHVRVFGSSRSRMERLQRVNHEKLEEEDTNSTNLHESKNIIRVNW